MEDPDEVASRTSPLIRSDLLRGNATVGWQRRLVNRLVPPPFPSRQVEFQFLREYRLAGLRSVAYACSFGAGVYVAFGILEAAYGAWTMEATFRRLIAVMLLASIAILIARWPERVLATYKPLLGTCSVIAVIGVVSVTRLLRDGDMTALVNPASLFALWVLYGFGRLPIGAAVFAGVIGSIFSMFGSLLTNMPEAEIRTAIYLVVANALGILLARSIEVRERLLFLQRGIEEAANAELQLRSSMAEQASEEKTRLIAAVGHDLRQPMLAAVIHADVLVKRLAAQDLVGARRQAESVQDAVKLLGETLEHVLTAARFDAGAAPISIRPVSLESLFVRLIDMFGREQAAGGITVRIRMPASRVMVVTDEQVLLRILVNLISNAIKFTPPRRSGSAGVVVRAFIRNEACKIFIADTGIGISADDLRLIWQPFYQVSNKERDRQKGLGLGLYLVKQSLLCLDGHSMGVRSVKGRGTRFTLQLPVADLSDVDVIARANHVEVDSIPSTVFDGSELKGSYCLLVEDDREAIAAIEALLDQWGIEYSSGPGVEEVMRLHERFPRRVDAILADYRLPGKMNGIESIRFIRQRLTYEPGAVLVSAESNVEAIVEGLPSSTRFVRKPFDSQTLADCIRTATLGVEDAVGAGSGRSFDRAAFTTPPPIPPHL